MEFPKPTEADKDLFRSLVSDFQGATVKPMFGNLGAFVNGHMFAALLGTIVGVKLLDETTRDDLRAQPGATGFGPGEKPLREYVGLPIAWPAEELSEWVGVAFLEAQALAPKK